MTKPMKSKMTNKICKGCTKKFSFDISINPTRKFCSKQCYSNFLKAPVEKTTEKTTLQKFFHFFRIFVITLICFECMQENILFKAIIDHRIAQYTLDEDYREIETFIMPDDSEIDLATQIGD